MKKYLVKSYKRMGIANFQSKESVMTEEEVRLNFPTWEGAEFHEVGGIRYQIIEIIDQTRS
jgi:hypothetical protein